MAFVRPERESIQLAAVRGSGALSAGSVPSWQDLELRAPRLIIALNGLFTATLV